MRLFIAAEMPEEIEDALLENLAELRELVDGKPVRPDSLHMTLAFIGEVPAERAADAAACLDAACTGHRGIDLELDDYGSFGRANKAVLWQGVVDDYEISQLADDVRYELGLAGFELEPRDFRAHVTLMRSANLAEMELPCPFGASGEVTRITLFESALTPTHAEYTPLHTVELPGSPRRVTEGPTLFIDADACPVTAEALAAARKAKLPVVIAGNSSQNLMRHARKDDPTEPCEGCWVSTLQVATGADSADFAIVEQLEPGDVVVTQDIGLAAMVLGRSAAAIGVRGRVYSLATIDSQLMVRHEEKKVRRQGGRTQGPAAFTDEDRDRFKRNLARLLAEATR